MLEIGEHKITSGLIELLTRAWLNRPVFQLKT